MFNKSGNQLNMRQNIHKDIAGMTRLIIYILYPFKQWRVAINRIKNMTLLSLISLKNVKDFAKCTESFIFLLYLFFVIYLKI